jgi:hypothetical protein
MEKIKDLLAFQGAGTFDRQFKVQVRKGLADTSASFVLGCLGVAGFLLIGLLLFFCIAAASHINLGPQQAACQPTTSQEIAAAPSSPMSSPEMSTTPSATPNPQPTSIPTPDSRRKIGPTAEFLNIRKLVARPT